MEQNGQLTFSDDPLLSSSYEIYQLIEEGGFSEAVLKLDKLMDINPDYPGFVDGYRTARFWNNRKDEIKNLQRGKQTADFLMREWDRFKKYAEENDIVEKAAYKSSMKYIFFTAAENYKIAFQEQESTADNFDLLVSLGICFLTLAEYRQAVETLEYARSSNRNSARLMSLLGEAYYHTDDISKSILFFREAFFINPSEIDTGFLNAKPVLDLIKIVKEKKPDCHDVREWIPIFGFVEDIFYVRRNLNNDQLETIKREIYSLEKSYQTTAKEKISESNIITRLINKYIWMLDYFVSQEYDFESIKEIKSRLIRIDKDIFEPYFQKKENLR